MKFQYTHLESNAIRVFKFSQYSTPISIHVWLEHLSDFRQPTASYSVIAYPQHDGDTTERQSITLNGRSFMVPAELCRALEALVTCRDTTGYFWAEAISINHADRAEQTEQQALRPRILSHAKRALVWLGARGPNLEETVRVLRELSLSCPYRSLEECMAGDKHRIATHEQDAAAISTVATAGDEVLARSGFIVTPEQKQHSASRASMILLNGETRVFTDDINHYQHACANTLRRESSRSGSL